MVFSAKSADGNLESAWYAHLSDAQEITVQYFTACIGRYAQTYTDSNSKKCMCV